MQCPQLGMSVESWNDEGEPVIGESGELVCTKPFPSMPIKFWNDSDGSKYHSAYFDEYDGVWTHGDYLEMTENGGAIIYGRSDTTLNPGGVRIGTAEIYNTVEKLDEIVECLVIAQNWNSDVRIVLFLKLKSDFKLTQQLEEKVVNQIKTNLTPRHVPAKLIAVPDIPRTRSGKITELAVRDIVHGKEIKNKEALANPEALSHFANIPTLSKD